MTAKDIVLVANGDLRDSANEACWAAQAALEDELVGAVEACGAALRRAHPVGPRHGFIGSQREGLAVFRTIDPEAPVIVAEAVWQYSQHLLPGLVHHRGPILTCANWSGTWPGLVGLLNLNASLTKAGVRHSSLWAESYATPDVRTKLSTWIGTGAIVHDLSHVRRLDMASLPDDCRRLGEALARTLVHEKAILGVFDEGCMGMYNAIIPDELLFPLGVFKERLSQSALYHETMQVDEEEGRAVLAWLRRRGMTFHLGKDEATELTEAQLLLQARLYIAAARLGDAFGCAAIGIQYQQGLKDLLPASDLAEGLLNNADRPPVHAADGREILAGRPFLHFNEVDECAGLDAVFTDRVHTALQEPVENTLHDLRWGDVDRSGSTDAFVWVLEISGAAPPEHHIDGYAGTDSHRQPPMYFRLGGGTVRGIAKPGEIVWSRLFVEDGRLKMDLGRAGVVALPKAETERRWRETTYQWPIMHAVTYGVSRDQMMARHKSNHIQVAYARSAVNADRALYAKAAMAAALGIEVFLCGTRADGSPL